MCVFTSAWMPLAVLAIGVAATAVAVRAISDSAVQRDQERFDRAAQADCLWSQVRAHRLAPIGPWCGSWWERFPSGYRLELEIGNPEG